MDSLPQGLYLYLEQFTYLSVFFILFLLGIGLPGSEEIVLVLGGYLCYQGLARLDLMMVVCLVALISGDFGTYLIGRIWGFRIIRLPPFSFILTKKRIQRVRSYFTKYGARTIFICRFIAGVRFCAYFLSGTMRLKIMTFLSMDFIASVITSVFTVCLGYYFGNNINKLIKILTEVKYTILGVVLSILLVWLLYRYFSYRKSGEGKVNSSQKEILH